MAYRERVMLAGTVNVVEPRAAAQMNALTDSRVQDAEDPCPDADVAPQVTGDGIWPFAQYVPRTCDERRAEQEKGRIGCGETGTRNRVLVWPCGIENHDRAGGQQQERKVMAEQAGARS